MLVQRAATPAAQWLDLTLTLTLPRLSYLTHVETWTRLARNVLGSNQATEYLNRPETLRLMTRRFGVDGALHLYTHYGVRSLFEQSLENGARSSKKILKNFAERYPDVLPPAVLASVEAFTADRDTFMTLVNEYLIGRTPRNFNGIAEIVGAAFDTPPIAMQAIIHSETGRRLMAAFSHFKARHGVNLLRSIAFDDAPPASAAGLDDYLYELRNAFNLELSLQAARQAHGQERAAQVFQAFLPERVRR
jgi:hypothetical protein